jgi:hypothetical protein
MVCGLQPLPPQWCLVGYMAIPMVCFPRKSTTSFEENTFYFLFFFVIRHLDLFVLTENPSKQRFYSFFFMSKLGHFYYKNRFLVQKEATHVDAPLPRAYMYMRLLWWYKRVDVFVSSLIRCLKKTVDMLYFFK